MTENRPPSVLIEIRPTDPAQLAGMLATLADHGLAPGGDEAHAAVWFEGFKEGRVEGRREGCAEVPTMSPDEWVAAATKVTEAGTYAEAPHSPEDRQCEIGDENGNRCQRTTGHPGAHRTPAGQYFKGPQEAEPAPPKESDGDVLARMGTDAAKWTDKFMRVQADPTSGPLEWGTMVGWFANAIEAGKAAGRSEWQDRNPGQVEKLTAELAGVRKQRDAHLTELRGQVDAWRGKHDALADELDDMRDTAANLEGNVAQARADRDEMRRQRDGWITERDVAVLELNRLRAARDRIRDETTRERDEARGIAETMVERGTAGLDLYAAVGLPWRGAKPAPHGTLIPGSDEVNPCISGTCGHTVITDALARDAAAPMVHP